MLMPMRQTVVAVVDDDADMLRAAEELLNAQGFATDNFLSAEESAEEFVRRGIASQIDCLLLDIQLGGMSGIELRHRLNVSCPGLPVIYMTSHNGELIRREALKSGCVAYLRKPFPAMQLIEAIESALR
jgi:FixJ family two-component response regulator